MKAQPAEVLEAIDSPETGELIDPAELADAGMSVVDVEDDDVAPAIRLARTPPAEASAHR